jgi:hypothetical protein
MAKIGIEVKKKHPKMSVQSGKISSRFGVLKKHDYHITIRQTPQ